jgi:hypothetical protein
MPQEPPEKRTRGRLEKVVTILIVPLALLLASGLGVPLLLDSLKASPAAEIRVGDVVIAHKYGRPSQAEFALHNVGESTGVLQHVSFEIERFAYLPVCVRASDMPVAKRFGVALPVPARPGQTIDSGPLRRQLAADEAERLAFQFSLARDEGLGGNTAIYRLKVVMWHDGKAEPTSLGNVIVSAGAPEPQAFEKLPDSPEGFGYAIVAAGDAKALRCLRDNTERLRRMLVYSDPRPGWMNGLDRRLLSPPAIAAAVAKFARAP